MSPGASDATASAPRAACWPPRGRLTAVGRGLPLRRKRGGLPVGSTPLMLVLGSSSCTETGGSRSNPQSAACCRIGDEAEACRRLRTRAKSSPSQALHRPRCGRLRLGGSDRARRVDRRDRRSNSIPARNHIGPSKAGLRRLSRRLLRPGCERPAVTNLGSERVSRAMRQRPALRRRQVRRSSDDRISSIAG